MILIPDGEKVRLCDMEPGLFLYGDDCLAVKTEYITDSGRIEAYIVSTGEYFHGGAKTAEEQRILMVQPLKVEPLVRCKDCEHGDFLGYSEGLLYCMKHSCYMDEDDFCSDGERGIKYVNLHFGCNKRSPVASDAIRRIAHYGSCCNLFVRTEEERR